MEKKFYYKMTSLPTYIFCGASFVRLFPYVFGANTYIFGMQM